MWNGKNKALTFSYDDGVLQDARLIKLFNKYGLKATFNLNSGRLGFIESIRSGGAQVDHSVVRAENIRELYSGHEIAAHTVTHPMLPSLSEDGIVSEIKEDCSKLTSLCGYDIVGMAYPGGGVNHDARVIQTIRNRIPNIRYARTTTSTYSFDLPGDLLELDPTVYHMELDRMEELAQAFLKLEPEKPQLFYIWGHAYELDAAADDAFWLRIERIFSSLAGRDDIFYGTNREVLLDMPGPKQ